MFKKLHQYSLNHWIHSSDSLGQYLQFSVGDVVQSWTRVAGQNNLNEDGRWSFIESNASTKYDSDVTVAATSPLFLEREALWQKASPLEWCLLHYYLRKTRHTYEEDPARENQDGLFSSTNRQQQTRQKHHRKRVCQRACIKSSYCQVGLIKASTLHP